MTALRSHLSVLETSASRFPSLSAFRLAQNSASSADVQTWTRISYQDFLGDVELAARYWYMKLSADGVSRKSVVGLWLAGMDYSDVVNIYGMSRAGFVPQLFSLRLPSPTVVFELLKKAQAKALVFDPSFRDIVQGPPVPAHPAVSISGLAGYEKESLPPFPAASSSEDLIFVFHTSGSTSGSPKLVPCNAGWLDSQIFKSAEVCTPKDSSRQDVSTWMGSMCHIGQTFMLLGALQHGSCTIRPTKIDFSSEELADMIKGCNLNRLHQFATFLTAHIRHAAHNPKLLVLLKSLDSIVYSGLPLPRDEEEFAYRSGIPLVNLFGSTECAAMLLSRGDGTPAGRFLKPLKGVNYGFFPSSPAKPTETGHVSVNNQLLELVILSDSPDCPHVSLRRSSDGHFHTGDLFQEVQPGQYISRGRDDDWIKSLNSLRCDTRSIEENVRATCADLVEECIVVGTGRPSPSLFVEPKTDMPHDQLRKEIVRRTRQFHSRRYMHERITSTEFVMVVDRKSLPRTATKGNIRRQAVEDAYKTLLDEIYGYEA